MHSLSKLTRRARADLDDLRQDLLKPARRPSLRSVVGRLDRLMTTADLAMTTVEAGNAARAARADLAAENARHLAQRVVAADRTRDDSDDVATADQQRPTRHFGARPRASWERPTPFGA
jgi:hypothetical protein